MRMQKIILFFILSLLFITASTLAQNNNLDRALAACQDADDSDVCLADYGIATADPTLCTAAIDPARCSETLTESVILICEDQSDAQTCFRHWGGQGLETACAHVTDEQVLCYLAVAAKTGDYSIVDRNIPDEETRDAAYAQLAILRTDPEAVAHIQNNERHDLAYIYLLASLGISEDADVSADYCTGLRGNYDSDYPEDAELNMGLCAQALAAITAWREASEEEQERILEELLAALDSGDEALALDVLARNLLDPDPITAAFERGWCRAPDANSPCDRPDIRTNMIFDADAGTIVHFPGNGAPRIYEDFMDNTYRLYYDTEITNDDGKTEIVTWYGEITIESPELFTWQFYNHLGSPIGTFSYYVPPPEELP